LGFRPHNLFLSDQKSSDILKHKENIKALCKYIIPNGNINDELRWKKYMIGSLIEKAS
jgi:hypothetical protein